MTLLLSNTCAWFWTLCTFYTLVLFSVLVVPAWPNHILWSLICNLTFLPLLFCRPWIARKPFLGAFAKLREATVIFVMSVFSSVCTEQLGFHWTDFHEIWYMTVFRKSVEKKIVSLKSDRITQVLDTFTELRKGTIGFVKSFRLSARLSTWNNYAPTGQIFMKFGF